MKKLALFCLLAALALASSCGYNFRGSTNNLPADIRKVAVPVFENKTVETNIERTFTDEVIFQFTRSQILRVVSVGDADALLKGTINRVEIADVAYTSGQTSRQRRVTVRINARLLRQSNGEVLWQDPALEAFRTYTVTDSVTADEAAKSAAITLLATDMARTLHDRVLENF